MKKCSLIFMISLIYLIVCFPKVVLAAAEVAPDYPGGKWDIYVEETYITDKEGADICTYSVMLVGGTGVKLGDIDLVSDR